MKNIGQILLKLGLIVTCILLIVTVGRHKIESRQIVENYCSTVYQTSVNDYKACRCLSDTALIKKITSESGKALSIVPIEDIK